MKKNYIILFLLIFSYSVAFSQGSDPQRVGSRLERASELEGANLYVDGFDKRQSDVLGSQYLFPEWKEGDVTLVTGKTLEGLKINYDVHNQLLEINDGKGIKVASEFDLKKFVVKDTLDREYTFISLADYTLDDGKFDGFGQLLYEGNVTLIKKYTLVVKEGKYVEGVDVGSFLDEIKKKEKFYIIKDRQVEEFSKRKSFGDKKKQVKDFVKTNRLNLSRERDIIFAVEFFDSLL